MSSNFKAVISTIALSIVVFASYAFFSYQDACLDICIMDKTSITIVGGLLGAVLGTVLGMALTASAALGICKKTLHFTACGAATMLVIGLAASATFEPTFNLFAIEHLYDIVVGMSMGLVFGWGRKGWSLFSKE